MGLPRVTRGVCVSLGGAPVSPSTSHRVPVSVFGARYGDPHVALLITLPLLSSLGMMADGGWVERGHQSGLGAAGGVCPRWAPPRQAEPHGLHASAVLFARCSLAINLPSLLAERGNGVPMGGDGGESCSVFVLLPPPQPFPMLLSPGCLKGKIMMACH